MAYTVSFGVMSKRENSTKQSYTEALSASCLLKETTDILNPTFSIQAQIVGDTLLPCNYMYVADFGRYYWITGIEFYHGVWYVSGETDVLATFKTEIGNTTTYILRASSDRDERIADGFYTLENVPVSLPNWKNLGFSTTGVVILSVIGNNDFDGTLGTDTYCYYAMLPSTWSKLYSVMYTSNFLNDYGSFWSNIATDVFNTMINPGDYISSAIWMPIPYSDINISESYITIANFTTGFQGKAIDPSTLLCYKSDSLTLPDHPQEATNGVWMRGNQCSKDSLLLPGYGTINLDSDIIASLAIRGLSYSYAVDCSGAITYHITYGSKDVYCSANIGTPCGFGDIRPDFSQAVSSVMTALGQYGSHNYSAMARSINDARLSVFPSVERISAGGSRTLPTIQPYIMSNSTFYLLPPDAYDNAGSGRPLGKTKQISTLSGYIVCCDTVSVECSGTRFEIEKINNYLSGGFYYE